MPSKFVPMRARSASAVAVVPSASTKRMQLAHMANDASHGASGWPLRRPSRALRCGMRCSNVLSSSMTKATNAWDKSADSENGSLISTTRRVMRRRDQLPTNASAKPSRIRGLRRDARVKCAFLNR
ncbi:MAG TPA: hypothetical protein VIK00_00295, partial [Candidatus Limnocylindrales bacterium]